MASPPHRRNTLVDAVPPRRDRRRAGSRADSGSRSTSTASTSSVGRPASGSVAAPPSAARGRDALRRQPAHEPLQPAERFAVSLEERRRPPRSIGRAARVSPAPAPTIWRRSVNRSSSMDCCAQRCQRVPAARSSNRCSSQSICSRSPSRKNPRATSRTERPVACATEMMSGPWTNSPWNACRRARSGGTPSATSRSAVCSCSSRQASGPIWSMTPDSSTKDAWASSTACARRCPVPRTRYQRDVGLDHPVDAGHQLVLDLGVDHAVERLDGRPALDRAGHVARDPEGADDLGRRRAPVSVTIRDTNVTPWEFTTSFAAIVAISSRRSGCSRDQVAEPLDHARREVPLEVAREVGRVGQVRVQQRLAAIERFAYASSTASSGRTMPTPSARRCSISSRGGQELDLALQLTLAPRAAPSGPRSSRSAGRTSTISCDRICACR